MKKNIFFALFSAMLLMTACQQHEIDSPADLGDGFTLVGHSDAQTKTSFGTPGASTIPFLWSEGDKIWNNGVQSEAASVSDDGATALFSFTSGSMAGQVYYNMTGASAEAHVESEQTIGNLGANGDFGYAEVNQGSFTLRHATAYLWFNVTSDVANATLESVKVKAYGANIAGKATWNGTSFEDLTEASKSVTLTVGQPLSSTNDNVWAMVIFPSALTGAKVTYKLTVDGQPKCFEQELTAAKTLNGGETARISANITSEGLKDYELRVLTFEDAHAEFTPYTLEYAGVDIATWSDLIDEPQYGGPMTYGDVQTAAYTWYDEGNTELYHMFPDQYGAYCFWGGGHAISNYWGKGFDDEDRDKHIAKYYGEDYATENAGNDQMLGWFNLQLMVPVQAHSGDNFAVHYGYLDDDGYGFYTSPGVSWSMCEKLVEISFGDGTPRIIDHMYVTNTNYTLNQLYNGVKSEAGNTFGGSWTGLNDDAWLMLVAYGFESIDDDAPATSTEFYLVKGQDVVTDWKKWDLSSLGAVAKVQFNFIYSEDMGGKYGFTIPGYFAYDDVAVRFPIE